MNNKKRTHNIGITKSLADGSTMSSLCAIDLQFGQTQQQPAAVVIFNKIFSIGICSGADGILIQNLR